MKKYIIILVIVFLICGCASTPSGTSSSKGISTGSNAGSGLDASIKKFGNDVASKLNSDNTIAILSIESNETRLSDYVINELTNVLVNIAVCPVVTRQKIDDLIGEINFNMSGYVSDDSAQSVGKMLGADIVIIGSITLINDIYRFNIQAIKTESGQLLAANGYDVQYNDSRINRFVNSSGSSRPIPIIGNELINRNSHNFVQLRDYAKFLIGAEYYVAIGRCNGYQVFYNNSGEITRFSPQGPTRITQVAIHVNPKTGEVLNILVNNPSNTAYGYAGVQELIGGISVDDYFKMNTWIETIRYIQENDIRVR